MDKKLVLVFGNFNIVHPGHLRLLNFAKGLKGKLHVGLISDRMAGQAIHIPEKLRIESLKALDVIDKVFLVDEPIENIIRRLKPYAVVKGKEFENQDNLEQKELDRYGGRLLFSSGEITFSSLDLLRKEMLDSNVSYIENPKKFHQRHGIVAKDLINIVKKFKEKKICVIGDIIVDEYITCEPLGMSQEDPTIVVKPLETLTFLGGAGIVASHGASLGAQTDSISITGDDDLRLYVQNELQKNNVKAHLFTDPSRPTTLKQKFRSRDKTLLRVSNLSQNSISKDLQIEILKKLKTLIKRIDLLIFSDFNYGTLPQPLVNEIIELARSSGTMLVADSQSSSQLGDISRFKNMDLITPTEREARLSLRDHESGIVQLAESLRKDTNSSNILLKLGGEGLMLHTGDPNIIGNWVTDRIQTLNLSPKDVIGAGDSLLVTSALALLAGSSIWEAASLGSLAAAIQVSRIGNVPITSDELLKHLEGF